MAACKKKSAAGPDGYPYVLFQNLPVEGRQTLRRLFNRWLIYDDIEGRDDFALQIGIEKELPGDYRGITLKNCMGKIYSRILYYRLSKFADDKVPSYQFGFRRHHSPGDQAL